MLGEGLGQSLWRPAKEKTELDKAVDKYLKEYKNTSALNLVAIPCAQRVKGQYASKKRPYTNLVYFTKKKDFKIGIFLENDETTTIVDLPQDALRRMLNIRELIRPIWTKTQMREQMSINQPWCEALKLNIRDEKPLEEALRTALSQEESFIERHDLM